ncbi:MAG: FKBP-type peptidyl-prolyl cis-trans isomerase [Oleiphilus sp.]|nr:MAG: FKBP-type peptidyl-prolyl cis-trans isomerase [Oleiphilus sp.]
MTIAISENTRVVLHFELRLEDGAVVDSTFDKAPANFEFGDGQLPEGFQSFLVGMKSGERGEFQVLPEKAFGMPNPNNMQTFKRGDFPDDLELSAGLVISFADASQSELPGVVSAFDDNEVTIDFNHPLAGKQLTFRVEIVDVQAL